MCGIAGFVYSNKYKYDEHILLNNMLDKITHRGYDNRGTFFSTTNYYNIGLGHNRLSIIDTSERANQPFHFDDLTIIFNGEIYNYKELGDLLLKNGYLLDTTSDTEIIIKLFHLYEERMLSLINGMFAIVLYNSKKNKIYLIRDRMGIKPLVYYKDDDHFYFSSEIKSFYKDIPRSKHMDIDKNLLNNYFKYGYINSFDSIFSNVKKVQNGQILTFNLDNFSHFENKFWTLEKSENVIIDNIDEAYLKLKNVLSSSVKYRLVSDVGYGIFLSSGIDSNLVLNYILSFNNNEINSYTYSGINSDENENAIQYDPNIVKQEYVELTNSQIWEYYKELCMKYDEPFSDPATIGLYGLAKIARIKNKVILVGDGGDELLGGYQSYELLFNCTRNNKKIKILRNIYKNISFLLDWFFQKYPLANHLNRVYLFHIILKFDNLFDIVQELENRFSPVIEKLTGHKNYYEKMKSLNKNSFVTFLNYKVNSELVHQLNYKTDIAGMLQNIEIREPLLDYRLFELQQSFSDCIFYDKRKGVGRKYLFRKILSSFNTKLFKLEKKGFQVDLKNVFKENISEIDSLVNNHTSSMIDMDYVKNIFEKFKKSKVDFVIINRILSFILWEKNLKNRI
jgi:asparagine synthase (glutamine-hydrolysing)